MLCLLVFFAELQNRHTDQTDMLSTYFLFLSNAFADCDVAPNTHRIYEDIRHCATWAFEQSDINKEEYNEKSREISLTALVTTLHVSSPLNKHRHDGCQHVVISSGAKPGHVLLST